MQLDALQLPPPLDALPELEPLEPEELPELEFGVQVPELQLPPVIVQSTQATPAVPHVVSAPLVWHVPVESQHPLRQESAQSAAASSDA